VKVNAVIARLSAEGESAPPAGKSAAPAGRDMAPPAPSARPQAAAPAAVAKDMPAPPPQKSAAPPPPPAAASPSPPPRPEPVSGSGGRILASPLARRIAAGRGIDLATITGTGPHGRIVRKDVEAAAPASAAAPAQPAAAAAPVPPAKAESAPAAVPVPAGLAPVEVPHEDQKLSSMRRTIARRLTESKQTVPHYYLTVDIQLDRLLKLRSDLNATLEPQGVKLSVNDLLVKALGLALTEVPDANVSFTGDAIRRYQRADISVAVAIPGGLITPVVRDAGNKRLSRIASEMKELAARAREGKLQPPEYSGGTASLSNLGMYGIRQFEAVINPPEGLIVAVGAGERRPWVVDDALAVATVMSASGSFDHRAIDGAVGAELMAAFRRLIENPLAMLA
jgi:pyruvate dehydrogenase E2 component (dihydrolipoamide acetyltransferase)